MKKFYQALWNFLPYLMLPCLVIGEGGLQSLAYFALWVHSVLSVLVIGALATLVFLLTAAFMLTKSKVKKRLEESKTPAISAPEPLYVALRLSYVAILAYYEYYGLAAAGFWTLLGITMLYVGINSLEKSIKEHNAKYPE